MLRDLDRAGIDPPAVALLTKDCGLLRERIES
jgi:hypothetical protein